MEIAKRIVYYNDLAALGIPYSKMQLARLEVKGQFPRRFYPTSGRCAWVAEELSQWIDQRIAERDTLPCRSLPNARKVTSARPTRTPAAPDAKHAKA